MVRAPHCLLDEQACVMHFSSLEETVDSKGQLQPDPKARTKFWCKRVVIRLFQKKRISIYKGVQYDDLVWV